MKRISGGFSLLEVLVSIFIILFGLLAAAALIPVANMEVFKASRADRSTLCALGALREVQIRQMCNPVFSGTQCVRWRPAVWGTAMVWGVGLGDGSPTQPFVLDPREAYAIDPLYIAAIRKNQAGKINDILRFPYGAANNSYTMQRITLDLFDPQPLSNPPTAPKRPQAPQEYAFFDRIFTWHDDLLFASKDEDLRPGQLWIEEYVKDPITSQYKPIGNLTPSIEGAFTWLVTVTPAPGLPDYPPAPAMPAYYSVAKKKLYSASIAVFQQRDFAEPGATLEAGEAAGERTAIVTFPGGGVAGGDVVLGVKNGTDIPNLEVRKGEWLMLCGADTDPSKSPPNDIIRKRFQWYKIVAVSELQSNPDPAHPNIKFGRQVTLAGADFSPSWCIDLDGDNNKQEAQAALFTGVVNVYTRLIELE